ncbi:hypothetical protein VTN00DRAFT_3089 [Thermoascus crustaceus]|uniref:uncharacterized protein n=1 Tax=Thermoascus crustaceus TaxID=5088 RepID=UPI003743D75B
MPNDAPPDSAGPSSPPPPLPEGWLAQWEGISRKWYYVQRATGKSQWELPTEPVILTPSTTPTSTGTGPSRAPFSRPQTNSPQMGSGPGGMITDGNYTGADRAGFSSFFCGPGNPPQLATGMLGRDSNQFVHDKPGGQTQQSLFGNFSHHQNSQQQQHAFGYSSAGQSGVYAGTAPQYPAPGQLPLGQSIASHSQAGSANGLIGGPQQPGLGLPQQFGVDAHGNLSSQFTQPATRITPPELSNPLQGGGTSAGTTMGPMGSIFPSTSQPQWQMGQQPPVPQGTKPQISQSDVGSAKSTLSGQSLNGYNQQQGLLQQQFPSQHPSQYPSQPVTSAPLQAQQYPTTQAPDGFGTQSAIGKPFSSQPAGLSGNLAPSDRGTQDTLRGIHTSESLLQQGIISQPFPLQTQYGPPIFGQQGHTPFQGTYGHSPLYQSFHPGQQTPGGSFGAADQNFSEPSSSLAGFSNQSTVTAGQFGSHIPPGNSQTSPFNQQGPSLSNRFGPQGFQQGKFGASGFAVDNHGDPSKYQGPSNDQMAQLRRSSTQQGVLSNPQGAFPQHPYQAHPNPGQWPGPNQVSRPSATDPQFVSGPWTATPGFGAGFPQASYYGYGGPGR